MRTALVNATNRAREAEERARLQQQMLADKMLALEKAKEATSVAFHENLGQQYLAYAVTARDEERKEVALALGAALTGRRQSVSCSPTRLRRCGASEPEAGSSWRSVSRADSHLVTPPLSPSDSELSDTVTLLSASNLHLTC
jgi:hypothetical protein